MPHLTLNKLQRGPTVTAIISLLSVDGDSGDVTTETIDIDGLVDVSFKYKLANQIIPFLRMKKQSNALNATVQIQISTRQFNKQFFCSAEWVEAEMIPLGFTSQSVVKGLNTWSYFMKVDITVLKIMPVPSPMIQLYEDSEFTDFQLQATDGNVALHKILLLAHSDVFKAMMMRGEWKEKAESHISIEGVTVQTLQHLKDYIYLGTLPDDGLESLLVFATRYLMGKMKMACITKLAQSITPEKTSNLVKLACQHNIPELVEAMLYQTPDKIINDSYQLKSKTKS